MDVSELTSLDVMVMDALTTTRTTVSTVALAATVWNPDQGVTLGADPVGLIHMVVEGLAERGLVTYRLHGRGAHGVEPRPWSGLGHTIRLTKDGWALMGYPNLTVQVGTRASTGQMLEEKGDRTNHRTHRARAEGGDIETLTFPAHRAKYPDHIHPLMNGDTDMDVMAHPKLAPVEDGSTRGYIKVTPELEARVIAYRTRFPLVDYQELANMVDLPKRTVQYILTDLPRLRATGDREPATGTIKQRILWVLDALDMDNVRELRRVLGRADTDHDIVHALHDLHKQGKVDFKEKGASKEPIDIHLTARARGEGLPKSKVEEQVDAEATTQAMADDAEPTKPAFTVVEEPESPFPLLDALLDREQRRLDADNKAFKYLEAAEVIKDIDPVAYSDLVAKAESDLPFPSPIEAEYLRYVAKNPGGDM